MLCPKCGASLPDGTPFCYSCGEKQPEMQQKETDSQEQQSQQTYKDEQTNQQNDSCGLVQY